MTEKLILVSHHLCPYVQRAAIALAEKDVPFERVSVDLGNKPAWFRRLSPLGKVPLLQVDGRVIFESNVILEYLEETLPNPLHPESAIDRADHRAWIEFGSAILNAIAKFYGAPDADSFETHRRDLASKFARVEERLQSGPFFAGGKFGLVDAVYGPIFRYFDTFDRIGDFGILSGLPKVGEWRAMLALRPSVRNAVAADYPDRLRDFLLRRESHLSSLMTQHRAVAPAV
jgi:glutathione S-transferase